MYGHNMAKKNRGPRWEFAVPGTYNPERGDTVVTIKSFAPSIEVSPLVVSIGGVREPLGVRNISCRKTKLEMATLH